MTDLTVLHQGDPLRGFLPPDSATEDERFNGPLYIRRTKESAALGFSIKPRRLNATGNCQGEPVARCNGIYKK